MLNNGANTERSNRDNSASGRERPLNAFRGLDQAQLQTRNYATLNFDNSMMITVNSSHRDRQDASARMLGNSRSNDNVTHNTLMQFGLTQSIMKNRSKPTVDERVNLVDTDFKYGGLRSVSSSKEYNLPPAVLHQRGNLTQMHKYKDDYSSSKNLLNCQSTALLSNASRASKNYGTLNKINSKFSNYAITRSLVTSENRNELLGSKLMANTAANSSVFSNIDAFNNQTRKRFGKSGMANALRGADAAKYQSGSDQHIDQDEFGGRAMPTVGNI